MPASPLRKTDMGEVVSIRPAEAPARAAEDGTRPAPPSVLAPKAPAPRIQAAASMLGSAYAAVSASARSLIDASPPSLPELWERHRQSAAMHDGSLWRGLRLMWGAGHCAAAGTAYLLIAVAFGPAGFALFLAALAVCWLFL